MVPVTCIIFRSTLIRGRHDQVVYATMSNVITGSS